VHEGLIAAASRHSEEYNRYRDELEDMNNDRQYDSAMEDAESHTAREVEGIFLSAWVAAQRGGSRELVGSVVAAVKATHQQQQQHPCQ
jgi:hypothetical protein